jgi:hypothetical protein
MLLSKKPIVFVSFTFIVFLLLPLPFQQSHLFMLLDDLSK